MFIVLLYCLPFFIMGQDSIIQYNDQLDGEIITYILNAKHLFEKTDVYPELMNGIPKAGMVSPAPLFIVLFRVFSPFVSFMIMLVICKVAAFVSMYLLTVRITGKKYLGFLLGTVFMMLSFYPVYGLSVPGQAFVFLAVLLLLDRKSTKKQIAVAYSLIAVYTLTSSLPLVGYGIVATIGVIALVYLFKDKKSFLKLVIADFEMTVLYMLMNMNLVNQILGRGYDFVSHKSERLMIGIGFFQSIVGQIMGHDSYVLCYQIYLIVFSVAAIVVCFILCKDKKKFVKNNPLMFITIGIIAVILVLVGFYDTKICVDFVNNSTGTLHDFYFGRVNWMLPVFWFVLFGTSASLFIDTLKKYNKKILNFIIPIPILIASVIVFWNAGFNSDVKVTVMKMIKGAEYKQITYREFYSKDLFDEAAKLIGKDKEDYKIVSMGILPSMATYNGFYCLDAYSNNYDVKYKHEFREIIADELEKSDYYKSYYDEWGNRCYIMLGNYILGINAWFYNISYSDIDINFDKIKEMGADYVFSASPIIDCDKYGLKLLNEEPIGSESDWYWLYIYEIN